MRQGLRFQDISRERLSCRSSCERHILLFTSKYSGSKERQRANKNFFQTVRKMLRFWIEVIVWMTQSMQTDSHGTSYLWVKLKNFTYITGNIGSNLRLTLTIDGQKTSIEGTGEKLDKTLYEKSLSGLSDLPITSMIVEEDKHEDSSTITLDKEGKTLKF